jgi:2-dehydro-3-deoxygluconokinase
MKTGYVLTAGETMGLFSASRVGEVHLGDSYRFSVGGTESNVAIGLSRLGTPAVWLGRVGDDEVGRVITRSLQGEQIDARVIVDDGARTAVMTRTKRLPGRSHVSYFRDRSAGSRLAPTDIPADLVRGAALVHLTGVTPALSKTAAAAVFELLRIAKLAGVPVSFDVNYRSRLWAPDDAIPVLRTIAAEADIILAGDSEAELLTGEQAADAQLTALASLGVASQIIIKRGAEGACGLFDGEREAAPGMPIAVVDTVGAGDAFAAGYLHALLQGAAPLHRLSLANRVAAFVCSADGDWEGLPLPSELGLLDDLEPVTR